MILKKCRVCNSPKLKKIFSLGNPPLANNLAKAGFTVNSVKTDVKVHIEKLDAGFTITKIELDTVGDIPGIDDKTFQQHALETKTTCPVSRAITGPKLLLNARLK